MRPNRFYPLQTWLASALILASIIVSKQERIFFHVFPTRLDDLIFYLIIISIGLFFSIPSLIVGHIFFKKLTQKRVAQITIRVVHLLVSTFILLLVLGAIYSIRRMSGLAETILWYMLGME